MKDPSELQGFMECPVLCNWPQATLKLQVKPWRSPICGHAVFHLEKLKDSVTVSNWVGIRSGAPEITKWPRLDRDAGQYWEELHCQTLQKPRHVHVLCHRGLELSCLEARMGMSRVSLRRSSVMNKVITCHLLIEPWRNSAPSLHLRWLSSEYQMQMRRLLVHLSTLSSGLWRILQRGSSLLLDWILIRPLMKQHSPLMMSCILWKSRGVERQLVSVTSVWKHSKLGEEAMIFGFHAVFTAAWWVFWYHSPLTWRRDWSSLFTVVRHCSAYQVRCLPICCWHGSIATWWNIRDPNSLGSHQVSQRLISS